MIVYSQVSNGALDMAQDHLNEMLRLCSGPIPSDSAADEELVAAQTKSISDVVHELVRQVTSPNHVVREQVIRLIFSIEADVYVWCNRLLGSSVLLCLLLETNFNTTNRLTENK